NLLLAVPLAADAGLGCERLSIMRGGTTRFISGVCAVLCLLSLSAAAAQACPMCSQSIAEESLLPHAYMYSIIFMLSMPAMVFTGIGSFTFFPYRQTAAAL